MTADSRSSSSSFSDLRALVQSFGAAAGMPFLSLDDDGAAAVRLESGSRFELEYLAEVDRLYVLVEVPGTLPDEAQAWKSVARASLQWSQHGLAVVVGTIDGEDRLLVTASLPAGTLTAEELGETAVRIVDAAQAAGELLAASGGEGLGVPPTPGPDAAYFRA